uniref:GAR domain-containing protein n=1 Tax=Parastrongyloides trichosuri TaxID=131310 RepID=A0A0N4ZUR5_PARTI
MSISQLQEEFVELQKEIGSLQDLLNSAIDESEISLEVVQHSIKSNIWELKVRLDDIALAIAQEKKNAKRKCELQQIAQRIFSMVKEIEVEIENAEEIESNDNSTLNDLSEAYENLKEIEEERLPKLEAEYSKLPITGSEDSLRNKTMEEQTKMMENLRNIQSSIMYKIEAMNNFNVLVGTFKMKFADISTMIDKAGSDVSKIFKIKNEQLPSLFEIVVEAKQLAGESNLKELKAVDDLEKNLHEMSKNLEIKLLDAEEKVVKDICIKLESPLRTLNINKIEKDIDILPHDCEAYKNLKNKINDTKMKLNHQMKTKKELEVIINALKEIETTPKKVLPVNEHIVAFRKKLNELTQLLKPKADALSFTGDDEIDNNIRKQRQILEFAIQSVKNELELKENERADIEKINGVTAGLENLCFESRDKPSEKDLLSSKEKFVLLKTKVEKKLKEVKGLDGVIVLDKLKVKVNKNIEMLKEASTNIDKILHDIEKYEKDLNGLMSEFNAVDNLMENLVTKSEELLKRYSQSAQPFEVATVDLKCIDDIVIEINENVSKMGSIVDTFKSYGMDYSSLSEKIEKYNSIVKNLEELKIKIEKDVKRECTLIEMKKNLQETLNRIAERANKLITKVGSNDL